VNIDDKLAAAAASITSMPGTEIGHQLQELQAAYRQRDSLTCARHQAELDSLDLDWAAYQLASQHDGAGDLAAAARWYKMAAANDFADAALRLGYVLEMLAAQRAASTGSRHHAAEREELTLVTEAARWYAEAYAAGHPEAAARLDDLVSRQDTRRPRLVGPVRPGDPAQERCEQGGLDAVVNGTDLATATTHFRHCTPCQHEFISHGGLLRAPQTPARQRHAASSHSPNTQRQQIPAGGLAR
jgi:hypothetical protein